MIHIHSSLLDGCSYAACRGGLIVEYLKGAGSLCSRSSTSSTLRPHQAALYLYACLSYDSYLIQPLATMSLHHEIVQTLQHAAEKRHKATQARKAAQSQTRGARGYHKLQRRLNRTKFLAPIDADTTQASIYYIKKRFLRYSRFSDGHLLTYTY